ncbi:MAG: alpha/beta fold hydrolase [Pseudohongiellaceae bacterium]
MKLFSQQYSEAGKPLLVLHGLFGSQSNWAWHCKQLAEQFAVYGVDLRNHGKSPHAAEMSYPLMAQDVEELLDKLKLKQCSILGHSMGGKVAMQLALSRPERIERLIVVDIAPTDYPAGNEAHIHIIDAMEALDLAKLQSRTEAEQLLEQDIPDPPTRKFIVTNLARDDAGEFRWRLNVAAIREAYDALRIKPGGGATFKQPVLFVKGANSNYIRERNEAEIFALFPAAKIEAIPNAGHWVHADQPQALQQVITEFLA